MAKKEFIFQGITSRTHADAVRELFKIKNIKRVVLSVAFVSESGVEQIATQVARHAAVTTVFAGIRNDITSYQGLAALIPITANLYAVDTGSRHVIFHPKLYLVKGGSRAGIVVGSANLTLGGLNNNIEAGMLLDFDLRDAADKEALRAIEEKLGNLIKEFPDNVLKVKSTTILDSMLSGGRVIDENTVAPPKPSSSFSATGNKDAVPRIALKVAPIHRALKNAKSASKPPKASATKTTKGVTAKKAAGVELELVWESKPLAHRDLNIPKGTTSNKTGSINLDKGLLSTATDHRHYFREEIFDGLHWSIGRAKTTEESYAKFHLVIKGISYGEFDLRIAHTIGKNSKTYKQKNAVTRLSWGPAKMYVENPNLIDRTLSLYRDKNSASHFVVEID